MVLQLIRPFADSAVLLYLAGAKTELQTGISGRKTHENPYLNYWLIATSASCDSQNVRAIQVQTGVS